MAGSDDKLSREERLAARLRANLHRRKAQARAMGACDKTAPDKPSLPNDESSG